MPLNPKVNTVLKEMWRLKEKRDNPEEILSVSEINFWSEHLNLMAEYYLINSDLWREEFRDSLKEGTCILWSDSEVRVFFEQE